MKPKQNQRVFYSVSNNINGPWSEIFDFVTENRSPFTFIAVADTDPPTEASKEISKTLSHPLLNYKLVIHAGDYVYDQ